jgi:Xaa-Pro aminopeptidase
LVDLIKTFGSRSLVEGDAVLDRARSVKTPTELKIMRRSARVSALGMEAAARGIRPGATELEIAAAAEYSMRRNGASEIAFPSIVMSGPRAALNEEVATNRRIRRGETIVVDQGCVYDDYATEFARTFTLGKPSREQTRAYRADHRSLTEAAKAIRPGVRAGEIDLVARKTLEEEGFGPYQHPYGTGHGEGLSPAEYPVIGPGARERLEEGMVIALEPTIFKRSVGAIRIENIFLVTSGGAENLTVRPPAEDYLG